MSRLKKLYRLNERALEGIYGKQFHCCSANSMAAVTVADFNIPRES